MSNPRDLVCMSCGATRLRSYYQVSRTGEAVKCFRCVLGHRPRVLISLKTAAVVGTALTIINQSDVVLQGAVNLGVALKIGLTYMVPYLVSTYGALAASKVRNEEP